MFEIGVVTDVKKMCGAVLRELAGKYNSSVRVLRVDVREFFRNVEW